MKAAFTRAYNKEAHLTPYSLQVVKASRPSIGPALDSEYNEESQEDATQFDEKEQDALETDAMIKVVYSALGRAPQRRWAPFCVKCHGVVRRAPQVVW